MILGGTYALLGIGTAQNHCIQTIVAAIKAAGKAEPKAIQQALWGVNVKGVNGNIAFIKKGPAGRESAQNVPNVYIVKIAGGKVAKP